MVVYLAGKITGSEDYELRFSNAEMVYKHLGHIVLNPTRNPLGLEHEQYMRIDMAMLREADMVVFLDGWQDSEGAQLEYEEAKRLGKKIERYSKNKLIVKDIG